MSLYVGKSVVVEACQWYPDVTIDGVSEGTVGDPMGFTPFEPHVHTERGIEWVRPGDWVVGLPDNPRVYSPENFARFFRLLVD